MAVSRNHFEELSCNSNARTNLESDCRSRILTRIVRVKPKEETHYPEIFSSKYESQEESHKGKIHAVSFPEST